MNPEINRCGWGSEARGLADRETRPRDRAVVARNGSRGALARGGRQEEVPPRPQQDLKA